jgi:O-acetyl-ADP-ribose deacetylase (regulator of RNase III)
MLAGCYTSSLTLANDNQVSTIAFPAISCGVYGYPIDDACTVALETCTAFMERHDRPEKVIFVLFSAELFAVYQRQLAGLFD